MTLGARVVTPGTGFRSLADVPEGVCLALDARHVDYDYDGAWVECVAIQVDGEPQWVLAVVTDTKGAGKVSFTITDHRSLRRIEP